MNLPARVRSPFSVRWKRFRHQGLPLLGFVGLVVLVGFLWQRQGLQANVLGRAEALRVNVLAGVDGRLLPLDESGQTGWQVFDEVRQGQVVARLDDSALRAQLDALRAKVAVARGQLQAQQVQTEVEAYDRQQQFYREAAQLACQVEKCRLDILDRLSAIQQDQIQLQRLSAQTEVVQLAKDRGLVSTWDSGDIRFEREIVAKRIDENNRALACARQTHTDALSRQKNLKVPPQADLEKLLSPIRAAITAAEAEVRTLEAQVAGLVLRSPINGKIAAVYYQPGQSVCAREMILTIAADEARYIVGYVRPEQGIRLSVGTRVGVRPRAPVAQTVDSAIESVAAQWEPLPLDLARDQKITELVLPVRVRIPEAIALRPGELVDLRIYGLNGL